MLGLTIIAWGNGLSDTIASASIAKKGSAEMALTFCIAGPIFNLMLGLGITLSMLCLATDTEFGQNGVPFDLSNGQTKEMILIIVGSIIILLTFMAISFLKKFTLKK